MPYMPYIIRPTEHVLSTDYPDFNLSFQYAGWPTKNMKIRQKSLQNRWGYSEYRDIGFEILDIALFETTAGSRYTLVLTETDLIKIETASGKTWSFQTPEYTTGTVTEITAEGVVTGNGTTWSTNLAAGDKFILDDDYTEDAEPRGGDANWATIGTVDTNTQISLSAAYTGTTGSGLSKTYTTRKIYSVPINEVWDWTIVNDKFIFTNGDTATQYWDATSKAVDLDATYALKAKYCVSFANRLVIADSYDGATHNPFRISWSVNGDPTDWTGVGSGYSDQIESSDFITGLGVVGNQMIVYRSDSIIVASTTGQATAPIVFPSTYTGTGCIAPGSLVSVDGTNMFVGRDDFYMISGDTPESIGTKIRELFFSVVGTTEASRTVGYVNYLDREISWISNTTIGKLVFVLDYKTSEWQVYEYAHDITVGGKGDV